MDNDMDTLSFSDADGGSFVLQYMQALRDNRTKWLPLPADPQATLEYHFFADAVYWSDECPSHLDFDLESAFRMVLNHRTSLLCGEVGRFPAVWNLARECYPTWPGFRSERCTANPELADRIQRIRRVSAWRMKRFNADPSNDFYPSD